MVNPPVTMATTIYNIPKTAALLLLQHCTLPKENTVSKKWNGVRNNNPTLPQAKSGEPEPKAKSQAVPWTLSSPPSPPSSKEREGGSIIKSWRGSARNRALFRAYRMKQGERKIGKQVFFQFSRGGWPKSRAPPLYSNAPATRRYPREDPRRWNSVAIIGRHSF